MKEMVVCVVYLTLIAAPMAAPPVAADARTKALVAGLASAAGTIVVMVSLNEDVEKQYTIGSPNQPVYYTATEKNFKSKHIILGSLGAGILIGTLVYTVSDKYANASRAFLNIAGGKPSINMPKLRYIPHKINRKLNLNLLSVQISSPHAKQE